jgi:hypothetical protein
MKFILVIITFISTSLLAQNKCAQVFKHVDFHVEYLKQRTLSIIKDKNIPAFYRRIGKQKVPVILLNQETYPIVKELLEDSISQSLALTGRGNDHSGLLIGARDFSEREFYSYPNQVPRENVKFGINDTSIIVRDFSKTIEKNKRGNYLLFNYSTTKDEKNVIEYYARIRRAGLFHVKNGWNPKEPIPFSLQTICKGEEKCHDYISFTSMVQEQINAIKGLIWLRAGKINSADFILSSPQAKEIQSLAKDKIMRINLSPYFTKNVGEKGILFGQEEVLHPRLFEHKVFFDLVNQLVLPEANHTQRLQLINLIVAAKALEEFKHVSKTLHINKYDPWPDHLNGSPRLNAIYVIHAENMQGEKELFRESFYSGKYENFFGANHHHMGGAKKWHLRLHEDK